MKRENNESGMILPLVIIFMLALTITGLAFLNMGVMEHNLAMREVHKTQAFYLADGGIDHLLVKLKAGEKPENWDKSPSGEYWVSIGTTPLGEGDYWVHYYADSPPYAISTGRVKEILRKVKVIVYKKSVFTYGVFGEGKVLLKGTPEVSSYRSDKLEFNPTANAKVGTNSTDEGAIELIGKAIIKGDAFCGAGSNLDLAISAEPGAITGNRNALDKHIDLPDVAIPKGLFPMGALSISGDASKSISAGGEYSSITLRGELTMISSGDLVVGSLSTAGNGKIIIPSGISVTIYVIGPQRSYLGGNAIENVDKNPTQFRIYGAGDCPEIELAGTTKFYGAVYAPGIPVTCTGTGDIYGAVVGGTVTLPGTAKVYCDEVLAEDPDYPQFVNLRNWEELP